MPSITLLIPIANILGITVTELLRGEKITNEKQLTTTEIEDIIVNSLDLTTQNLIYKQKKRWLFAFLISIAIVVIETFLLIIFGITIKQTKNSLYVTLPMLLFGCWFCIFAKDLLPTYYDRNKINFVSQGIFKIHIVGLSFNNGNWPYVLTVFRVFTLGTAILAPVIFHISNLIGGNTLWSTIKYASLIFLLITIYIVGKKYE